MNIVQLHSQNFERTILNKLNVGDFFIFDADKTQSTWLYVGVGKEDFKDKPIVAGMSTPFGFSATVPKDVEKPTQQPDKLLVVNVCTGKYEFLPRARFIYKIKTKFEVQPRI